MELVDIYADEGITGTRVDKREEFQRMMKDCRKGKIDRILTKSISRFARNTIDCLRSMRELKELGISIYFEKEGIDTAEISSEMIFAMMGSLAQEESVSISNNMRLGCRMRMKNGTFINNVVPYGYDFIDRTMVINEVQAEIVKRIYNEYLSGKGISVITKGLNHDRIPPNDGAKKWYTNIVRCILSNEKYIGDMLMQKSYRTETLPFRKMDNNGEHNKYYKTNSHEAIISKEAFEKAQKLKARKAPTERIEPIKDAKIFTRYLICGECEHMFKQKISNGKAYWVCKEHDRGKDNCTMPPASEQAIHKAFITLYTKLKCNSKHILSPMLSQLSALKTQTTYGKNVYDTKGIGIPLLILRRNLEQYFIKTV